MTITGADRPDLESKEWRQVTGLPGDVEVFTRLAMDEDGRIVVRDVVVRSTSRVASDHLQRIPLGTIERIMNTYQQEADARDAVHELEALVRRPDDTKQTFAARVAEHYRIYSAISRSPAPLIARKAGVPVSRVHRWISEARRLGALPPGRRGTAG